jgi:hypothetical protein
MAMNFFCSETSSFVYRVNSRSERKAFIDGVEFKLLKIEDVTVELWEKVKAAQGVASVNYLKLMYGRYGTSILLVFVNSGLAAILWIVPGHIIKAKYNFVSCDDMAIISCVTSPEYRGKGLYPRGIDFIASSGLSDVYVIWASEANGASLSGIVKAGGVLIGKFIRRKWLFGFISRVYYAPVSP